LSVPKPIGFQFTDGQEADSSWVLLVLTDFEFGTLLPDKGYDTDNILDFRTQSGSEACIPLKSNRMVKREYDNLQKVF